MRAWRSSFFTVPFVTMGAGRRAAQRHQLRLVLPVHRLGVETTRPYFGPPRLGAVQGRGPALSLSGVEDTAPPVAPIFYLFIHNEIYIL